MMFTKSILAVALGFLSVVSAAPTMRRDDVAQREIHVLGLRSIPNEPLDVVKRNSAKTDYKMINRRQGISAEIAVKTDASGRIVPYKRSPQIDVEEAVKTDENGRIVPYKKRTPQGISAEIAVKTDASGRIVPYKKRSPQGISAEIAVKTDASGRIVPYAKREPQIDAAVAVKTDGNGRIVPY